MQPIQPSVCRFDAVLFDMDGIIIDSEPLWDEMLTLFLSEHGGRYSDSIKYALLGKRQEQIYRLFRARFDLKLTFQEYSDACMAILRPLYHEKLTLRGGFIEVLALCRNAGLKAAVASGSPQHLIDWVMTRFQLEGAFDVIVSAESVAHGKPAPDVFLKAAALLQVKPARCLVIEDASSGVEAGNRAGCFTIAVPDPGDPADFTSAGMLMGDLHEVARSLPTLLCGEV